MYFPKQILVLLIWVPILVQSQDPERCNGNNRQDCVNWARQGECVKPRGFMQTNCRKSCNFCNNVITGCIDSSQCNNNEICDGRRCVINPCSGFRCRSNTQCQVVQGQAQCQPISGCIDSSQCSNNEICDRRRCVVDPCWRAQCRSNTQCQVVQGQAQCQPIPGCSDNSQCGNSGICDGGRCVFHPCVAVKCGKNKECVALSTGQAQCQPISGCSDNSHCSNNGICDKGRCVVNLCSTAQCGTNNKCVVVRGEVQCQPLQEGLVFDRTNNKGAGVDGITQGSSQGGSISGSSQGGNQASITQGGNPQGSATHGANQHGSAQGGNQVETTRGGCTDKSHCNNKEVCENGKCVSPCDLIQCGQDAICNVIDNGNGALPQCNCPVGTTGMPTEQCTPIQDSNGNISSQPSPGSDKPAAPVSSCRINSQCGAKERCQSGRCINPCALFECGEGATCQVSQRQPQCVCPAGTEGNPREECKTITGNAASATKPPSSVTNQPSSTSGTSPDTSFPDGKGTRLPGCETVPDPGECRGAFPRYYFNKAKDQCDCFLFGGCDEDRVKFTWPTFAECLNKCVPTNTTKGSGCKRVSVDEVKEFLEQQRRNRENNGS